MKRIDHLLAAGFSYLKNKDAKALRALISEVPELASMRHNHKCMLHVAAENGDLQALATLLESGADPNLNEGEWLEDEKKYNPGYTPLFYAVRYDKFEAVKFLLENDADASICFYDGGCLLHIASDPQIIEMLIKAGAPLDADCYTRHFDELLGWHFIGTPLHNVSDSSEMVHLLVHHGANVNALEHITRRTPLHYASARGFTKAVSALIELGADLNATDENHGYSGRSKLAPIHYAAGNGNSNIVNLLASAGADINLMAIIEQSNIAYQMSALHYAVNEEYEDVVLILLKHGAATNIHGSWDNKTPKQIAKANGLHYFD